MRGWSGWRARAAQRLRNKKWHAIWYTSCFFFSSRRRHTRCSRDWSSDVCSSDLGAGATALDPLYPWGATVEGASGGGAWDSLFVATNRWRIGRDGRTYAARGVNRGRLRYGRAAASSLADWYVDRDGGLVEVRLAWGLLNVTDPSSRRVLRRITLPDRFETTVSEGFRFAVAAVARDDGAVRAWLPAGATFAWATWEEPVWHERLKPVYAALRDVTGLRRSRSEEHTSELQSRLHLVCRLLLEKKNIN